MATTRHALARIAAEAGSCERCPLFRNATQTVFGDGPAPAPVMLVGEQPGDSEDKAGLPFVGPAGRILDRALQEAGIDRARVYVTNAVKHFKNVPRGKRRIHQRPNRYEIERCRWWLDQELDLVRPRLVVALGATAASALMGRVVAIARSRGRVFRLGEHLDGLVTVHPSYVLRLRDAAREAELLHLTDDLRRVGDVVPESRIRNAVTSQRAVG
jgi:uracil-DNA glycosylase family protein